MWQQMRILARLRRSDFPGGLGRGWKWIVHPALQPADHHRVAVVYLEAHERSDDRVARANYLVGKAVCCELVTQVDRIDLTSTNAAMQKSCASIYLFGCQRMTVMVDLRRATECATQPLCAEGGTRCCLSLWSIYTPIQ